MAEGMQRGRAAGPLAKMVLYYNTHLAHRVIADSGVMNGPRGQSSNPHRLPGLLASVTGPILDLLS